MQQNNGGKKPKRPMLNMYWMYGLIALSLIALFQFQNNSQEREIEYNSFWEYAQKGYYDEIEVNRENLQLRGKLNSAGIKAYSKDKDYNSNVDGADLYLTTQGASVDRFAKKVDEINEKRRENKQKEIIVKYENGSELGKLFIYFGPVILFVVLMYLLSRRMNGAGGGGGIFSVGKSKAKIFDKNNSTNVTFKDVAGLAEAKVEIQEIVDFLKNPQRYTELGAKIPRGALLVGPPGTGKTLLAKAVAGEAGVPFLSMSGSDFVEMFVGVGAARVRDLFKQAKEKAPCIVFIDEIDAVGRARGKNPNMGSNDERENTLNQMLTEMDGFGSNNGVIILAATNRADMLDKALLRPGRFDRQIYVDLPELTDRIEILNVHLRNIKVNATLDIEQLARQTSGFSGADLANVCNEAALIAARNKKSEVDMEDFRKAVDRIVGGLEKKSIVYTKEEKLAIATHEAGHATVSWLIEYGNPLVKVTIVPRGRAGGYAMYAPEERHYTPIQSLLDTVCTFLAGRAAEEVFTGQIGTGASDDLEKATKITLSMVMYYGASDRLKNLNYYDSTGQSYGFSKPYSDSTAKIIDEEVARIIAEQYERAKEILRKYAKEHNQIRDLLIAQEVIYNEDVKNILGPRQWKSRHDEDTKKESPANDDGTIKDITAEVTDLSEDINTDTAQLETTTESSTPQNTTDGGKTDDDEDAGTPPPFNKKD